MVRLRMSKLSLTASVVFLLVAATLFAIHAHAFWYGDPTADAALYFFLLTLPWVYLLPVWLTNASWWPDAVYVAGWLFVGVNAFLLYCVTGGLAFGRSVTADDRADRRRRTPDLHAARDG
jgi:hypothetical protein